MNIPPDGFLEKLAIASSALQEAEDLLRNAGFKVPEENVYINEKDKVKFPRKYIRTVQYFKDKYNLDQILQRSDITSNISYHLQLSDFLNYIINRFGIGLTVESMFYKLAMVNILSIIEALIYGAAKNLHSKCSDGNETCKHNTKCNYYISSPKKLNFNQIIDILTSKDILNLSSEQKDLLKNLKKLRDNVHIWNLEFNEYTKNNYNLSNYNASIKFLYYIGKSLSSKIIEFERKKSADCFKMKFAGN